jgi:hypothetical protein
MEEIVRETVWKDLLNRRRKIGIRHTYLLQYPEAISLKQMAVKEEKVRELSGGFICEKKSLFCRY